MINLHERQDHIAGAVMSVEDMVEEGYIDDAILALLDITRELRMRITELEVKLSYDSDE